LRCCEIGIGPANAFKAGGKEARRLAAEAIKAPNGPTVSLTITDPRGPKVSWFDRFIVPTL